VFENEVLRRIFGPKRDEVTGGWRKLHNEELHNLYSSPCIIRMMKWAEHVARTGRRGVYIGYRWEKQKERDRWKDQGVGGWIILKWILERQDGMVWITLTRLRIRTSGRLF
jgi:hypothetical protein